MRGESGVAPTAADVERLAEALARALAAWWMAQQQKAVQPPAPPAQPVTPPGDRSKWT